MDPQCLNVLAFVLGMERTNEFTIFKDVTRNYKMTTFQAIIRLDETS